MKKTLSAFGIFIVFAGLAGCNAMSKGDPQWDPPVLSKTGCPDIDGVYHDNNLLSRQFNPYAQAEGETLPVKMVQHRGLPNSQEEDKTITLIKRHGNVLEITRTSPSGKLYTQSQLDMTHHWVGCHGGKLIMRKWSLHQGAEGTCGTASARDVSFHKRPDGSLQVDYKVRDWNCTMNKEPKRSNASLLFKPVH